MATFEKSENNKMFISCAQGALRQSVPEGTPNAIPRTWEAGGRKGTKHEFVFNAVVGKIMNVSFYEGESDGKKFQTIQIELDAAEGEKTPVITAGVDTKYGKDIMRKLPNVDLEQEVRIRPFSFTPDGEDKAVTGVELTQPDASGKFTKKVDSFFHKFDPTTKRTSPINGFPTSDKSYDQMSDGERKILAIQKEEFLITYTKEKIVPLFAQAAVVPHPAYPDRNLNPDDIPFE